MYLDTVHIRPADPTDAADAIRLFGALHQHNTQLDPHFVLAEGWEQLVEEYLRESQQADESVWLLACDNGTAIGFVLVEVHTDSPLYRHRRWAEIVGLYVDPAYRGTIVAHTLMEHAYAWAIDHHLRIMQLYVTATNEPAQRFYSKQGFDTSQVIMRRRCSSDDLIDPELPAPQHQRLHFSESGARPMNMHDRQQYE